MEELRQSLMPNEECLRSSMELVNILRGTCMLLIMTERGSMVGSMSASQAAVSLSILASGSFFHGKITSLFSCFKKSYLSVTGKRIGT